MTGDRIGPSHQRVADDLRSRIDSGEYPVGEAIPSTNRLTDMHDVSVSVVRQAVRHLMDEGLLVGHGGKGVYVRATPEMLAEEQVTVERLGEQFGELRDEVRGLAARLGDGSPGADLVAEVAYLRRQVGALQAHMIDLYARLGYPYPDGLGDQAGLQDEQRDTGS